jgi:hypothetical protein
LPQVIGRFDRREIVFQLEQAAQRRRVVSRVVEPAKPLSCDRRERTPLPLLKLWLCWGGVEEFSNPGSGVDDESRAGSGEVGCVEVAAA